MTDRERLTEVAQEAIRDWVDTACKIAAATFSADDDSAQKAIHQLRWLHLAEPWLPAVAIADAYTEAEDTVACRCAQPQWRETIFNTRMCLRCGTRDEKPLRGAR